MRRFTRRGDRDAAPPCSSLRSSRPCCSSSPSAPPRWAWHGWPTTGSRDPCPRPRGSRASSGDLAEADLNILRSLRSSLPQEQLNNLDRVVVFQVDHRQRRRPSRLHQASGLHRRGRAWTSPATRYSGATVRGNAPRPTRRFARTTLAPADPQRPTWLGPAGLHRCVGPHPVQAATGTFFDDMTITKTSIYRIQPDIEADAGAPR